MPSPFSRRFLFTATGATSLALLGTTPAQAATVRGGIGTYYNNTSGVKAALGLPVSDEKSITAAKNVYYQQFQRGIIIWNDQKGASHYTEGAYQQTGYNNLLRRTDKVLGAQDALVITDSQGGTEDGTLIGDYTSSYQSWITLGIRNAGWKTAHFHHGARGVIQPVGRPSFPSGVSYLRGIKDGANPLPLGVPGIIWISMSYNDFSRGAEATIQGFQELISTLRAIYPGAPIIFNELISRRPGDPVYQANPGYWGNRNYFTQVIRDALSPTGVQFLPNNPWFTDSNIVLADSLKTNLQDPHLNLTGHQKVAPRVTAWLKANGFVAYPIKGGIKAYYDSHGGESTFGTPTQNEFSSVGGGYIQNFSKRWAIHWTPQYGTFAIRWGTAIGAKYTQENYEHGILGYPISDEKPHADGVIQDFWNPTTNRKYTVAWSPATKDAYIMVKGGAIYGRFIDTPSVGFPFTDEIEKTEVPGAIQYFKNSAGRETGVYWSASTGAKIMNAKGALYFHYFRNGYLNKYGYPTTDETTTAQYTYIKFSKGLELRWTATGGVQEIK